MELRINTHGDSTSLHGFRSPIKKYSNERNGMTEGKISHDKFMAIYKVNECKKKFNHDKRQCMNWHSQADRRRNPFVVGYSTVEVSKWNVMIHNSHISTKIIFSSNAV